MHSSEIESALILRFTSQACHFGQPDCLGGMEEIMGVKRKEQDVKLRVCCEEDYDRQQRRQHSDETERRW